MRVYNLHTTHKISLEPTPLCLTSDCFLGFNHVHVPTALTAIYSDLM